MLLLSEPSDAQIRNFLARAAESNFTYSEIGATSALIPPLFTVDRNRVRLGSGSHTWQEAVEAVTKWDMFNLGWVRLYWPDTPLATNQNVAIQAHHMGCYWLNACRIVYVIDEDGPVKRFGFAYGTLEDHAESGEERFLVEWNRASDEVSYDLLAFSRPHQFLSRVGRPFARILQKRFATQSKAAMVRAAARADREN
jgi:uncharacterized protein (UPF0548 family)